MIVTFTANPSVDRTAEVAELRRGDVLRARSVRVDGGGKGVNVTRALSANGHAAAAVLPAGGAEGAQLLALLADERLAVRAVPVAGAIRANVTIVEPDGTTTKINEPGPRLADGEIAALTDTLLDAAAGAEWAVLSGSLPPGAPNDLYASLTRALHAQGVRVAVDTEGDLVRRTLAAAPDLIKPNRSELGEAAGGAAVRTLSEALAAIAQLRRAGARSVLASLGGDGAVLVDSSGVHHAHAEVVARSTVGAGDAMLAGFLAAGGAGPDALAEAVAWGAAAVTLPGSRMPTPTDIDRSAVMTQSLNPLEVTA
ncbi:MAG TPA: 1-phosphofructokinase [Solirubrobacteraceae bacterium]|nr:1-phosphofructokinase [Solirubrobacteraceae bacterium]